MGTGGEEGRLREVDRQTVGACVRVKERKKTLQQQPHHSPFQETRGCCSSAHTDNQGDGRGKQEARGKERNVGALKKEEIVREGW